MVDSPDIVALIAISQWCLLILAGSEQAVSRLFISGEFTRISLILQPAVRTRNNLTFDGSRAVDSRQHSFDFTHAGLAINQTYFAVEGTVRQTYAAFVHTD
jgi:hypothetical protein